MKRGDGGIQRLRSAYQKAFEESFVDNFKEWQATLCDVNDSINALSEVGGKKFTTYTYDEFCCLAKTIIDARMEEMEWGAILDAESLKMKRSRSKNTYLRNAEARLIKHISQTEITVMFRCFEEAVKSRVGPKMFKIFQKEIRQLDAN
jgi:hypothetical protein